MAEKEQTMSAEEAKRSVEGMSQLADMLAESVARRMEPAMLSMGDALMRHLHVNPLQQCTLFFMEVLLKTPHVTYSSPEEMAANAVELAVATLNAVDAESAKLAQELKSRADSMGGSEDGSTGEK